MSSVFSLFAQLARIFGLIRPRLRVYLVALVFLGALTSALEVIGVLAIFPVLQLMLDRDRLMHQAWFREWFGGIAPDRLLLAVCVALVVLFLFKIATGIFVSWFRLHVQSSILRSLSQTLFATYLRMPLSFHHQQRSMELVRNLTSYSSQTAQYGFLGVVDLFSEVLTCGGIFTSLAFVEPRVTLLALIAVSSIGALYVRFTQAHFVRWGQQYNAASARLTQTALEALIGIKTIKTLGCEGYFDNEYRRHLADYSNLNLKTHFMGFVPRQVLEFFAIFAVAGMIAWATLSGKNLATFLTLLGLFAAAIYRMMPSIVRLAVTLQNFRVGQDAVDAMVNHLAFATATSNQWPSPPKSKPVARTIILKDVCFTHPGSKRPTLDGINLTLNRGEIVAFVGPSGAGKTTLADVILGLYRLDGGEIMIDGVSYADPTSMPRGMLGYVPQEPFLVDDTIRRNIALGVPDRDVDESRMTAAVKMAALQPFIAELPMGLDSLVGDRGVRISGGQRQRIGIARAVYADPDILILDEATSSVDIRTEADITESIRNLRGVKTVIVIAHRLSTVRECDRIFYLQNGRIVGQGKFDDLIRINADFAAMVRQMGIEGHAGAFESAK